MNEDALVTVWCETYNFSEYLQDCIEGFLRQKTNFKYQVFIFDDASTDNSQEIIAKYVQKYPEVIKAYLSPVNTYRKPERIGLIKGLQEEYAKGKYYAICEGDDYWIDPNKLQKQVDFMEEHPECSLTIHASHWIDYSNGIEYDYHPYHESRFLSAEEVILMQGGNPSTASYVYRMREPCAEEDALFEKCDVGDVIRQLIELSKGEIYYFDEVMSVYRRSHEGSWTIGYQTDKKYQIEHAYRMRQFYREYDKYTNHRYQNYVRTKYRLYVLDGALNDTEVSMDAYFRMLNESTVISEQDRAEHDDDRWRIGRIFRGEYMLNATEAKMLNKSEHIVIYGHGKYAMYMKKILEQAGVTLTGYILSDDQNGESVKEEAVWRLCEYPYDFSKTAVVIGVGEKLRGAVCDQLQRYNIKNYIDSIWVRG